MRVLRLRGDPTLHYCITLTLWCWWDRWWLAVLAVPSSRALSSPPPWPLQPGTSGQSAGTSGPGRPPSTGLTIQGGGCSPHHETDYEGNFQTSVEGNINSHHCSTIPNTLYYCKLKLAYNEDINKINKSIENALVKPGKQHFPYFLFVFLFNFDNNVHSKVAHRLYDTKTFPPQLWVFTQEEWSK